MAINIGRFNISISATAAGLGRVFSKVQQQAKGFGASFTKSLAGVGASVAGLGASIATLGVGAIATGGVAAGGLFSSLGIRAAAAEEQVRVSLTTIIGDKEKAEKLLTDINQFAASTPFQLPDLQTSARQLLAFGTSSEDVVGTLRRIGDVSAGVAAPISEIAELYGKARVQGRLFTEDINQLTGRGIPIISELAKQFGVTEQEVKKLVEGGNVSFANLEQAFISLTSEGGKFFGLTQAQSQTTLGLFSTFKDNVSQVAKVFSESLLPTINSFLTTSTSSLQTLTPAFQILGSLVSELVKSLGSVVQTMFGVGAAVTGVDPVVAVFATINQLAANAIIIISRTTQAIEFLFLKFEEFVSGPSNSLDRKMQELARRAQETEDLASRDFFKETIDRVKEFETSLKESGTNAVNAVKEQTKAVFAVADPALKKLEDRAKQLSQQFQSPEDSLRATVTEVSDLVNRGLINVQVANRATEAALKSYNSTTKQLIDSQNPRLLRRGSVEAAQTRNDFSRIEKTGVQQLSALARANDLLARIAAAGDDEINLTAVLANN